MATFKIPNTQGQTRVAQKSETTGEILESFSVNLNFPIGKIQSSRTLTKVLDETDLGDERIQALAVYYKQGSLLAPKYYAITDDYVATCNTLDDPTNPDNWSEETGISTSNFGDETDAVVFDDKLIISRSQDLLSWNDSTDDNNWGTTVANLPSLTANYPHTLHAHSGNGGEFLFVTDANKVHYTEIVGASGNASTVTLAKDRVACCIDSGVSATWVGTYSNSNNNALVYEIYTGEQLDGTPVARNAFEVDGRAVLSLVVLNNIPYIITDKGNLQAFNGAGFTTVASLPFSGTSFVLSGMRIGNVDSDNNQRPVHPKGMKTSNDSIYININTEADNRLEIQGEYAERTPSGVYEYNTLTGQLHHRYSFGKSKLLDFTGPILITETPYTFLLAGAEINDTTAGLYAEGSSSYGYITTVEIDSGTVQDAWEAQYIKAKTLTGSDNIELKYRLTKKDKQFFTFTLADANTLNTTDTVSIELGDEITIIDNTGVGNVGHVTNIDTGAVVTSITVDTVMGTAGDTGIAETINFKKYTDTYTSEDYEYKKYGLDETSPWVQFKIVFNGEVEMREFISKGTAKTGR